MIDYINFENGKTPEFLYNQMQGENLTQALINQELTGVFNTETLRDMRHTLEMYRVYISGADFQTDQSSNDWTPAQWHAKKIKSLIDKEARFLFAKSPDIRLKDLHNVKEGVNTRLSVNEELLHKVLEENKFNSKLVRAAKDCLIGKRLAIVVNFNQDGIQINLLPSLEFVYETDPSNVDRLTKLIQFYSTVVNEDKDQQRIYKKKWYIAEDGMCHVEEGLYDGNANLMEEITPDTATLFNHIPACVIVNDGLSGDPFGISDVESIEDTESWYSKLRNKDIDSLRKGTDQIVYAMDVSPRSTKGLSRAPGAFWDMSSDEAADGKSGSIGTLDNSMAYSPALQQTLTSLETDMYSQLDVPNTSNEALQGIITSGKGMKAIYWGLIVRCDEKMLDWEPAFVQMVHNIFEGAKLYPDITRKYVEPTKLVDEYKIDVDNRYSLLEDETEEKSSDLAEVSAQTMSRKSYMKKWRHMSDDEIEAELDQIQMEKSMLEEDSYPSEEEMVGTEQGTEESTEGEEELTTGTEGDQELNQLFDDFSKELDKM